MTNYRVVWIWIAGLTVGSAARAAVPQALSQADSRAHAIQDLMRLNQKGTEILMGVWIPAALIEMGMEQSPIPVPQPQREQILNLLKQFIIVFVDARTIGPLGGATPKTEDEIRTGVRVVDSAGRSYGPLADQLVPADVKMLAATFKASSGVNDGMSRMLVFPGTGEDGKMVADPREEGSLTLRLGEMQITWKLPLGSFLPPKTCPVDGETMNGGWSYCPWHGSQLSAGARPMEPVRVGADLKPPRKIHDVAPIYPEEAKKSWIQGTVILEAIVTPEGNVSNVRVLRSIPALDQAAIDAVKQWRYEPTLLDGRAVPIVMTVTVNFALSASPR